MTTNHRAEEIRRHSLYFPYFFLWCLRLASLDRTVYAVDHREIEAALSAAHSLSLALFASRSFASLSFACLSLPANTKVSEDRTDQIRAGK